MEFDVNTEVFPKLYEKDPTSFRHQILIIRLLKCHSQFTELADDSSTISLGLSRTAWQYQYPVKYHYSDYICRYTFWCVNWKIKSHPGILVWSSVSVHAQSVMASTQLIFRYNFKQHDCQISRNPHHMLNVEQSNVLKLWKLKKWKSVCRIWQHVLKAEKWWGPLMLLEHCVNSSSMPDVCEDQTCAQKSLFKIGLNYLF